MVISHGLKWKLGHISHHPPEPRRRRSIKPRKRITALERVMSVPIIAQSKGRGYSGKRSISIPHSPVNPPSLDTANQLERRCWWFLEALEPRDQMKKRLLQWVRTQGHHFQVEMMQACLHPQMFSYTYSRSTSVCPHKHRKRRKACPHIKETNPIVNPMEHVANQALRSVSTRTSIWELPLTPRKLSARTPQVLGLLLPDFSTVFQQNRFVIFSEAPGTICFYYIFIGVNSRTFQQPALLHWTHKGRFPQATCKLLEMTSLWLLHTFMPCGNRGKND